MPSVFDETSVPPIVESARKRWTRAECQAMGKTGLLDLRWMELVDGDLIRTFGKKRPHSNTAHELALWLYQFFGGDFVQTEVPIDVSPEDNPTSEPVPDLLLLRVPFREFREENPHPGHIRLVIEVSDASAAIVEYWVVDVTKRQIVVHREPVGGRYTSKTVYAEARVFPRLVRALCLWFRRFYPKSDSSMLKACRTPVVILFID